MLLKSFPLTVCTCRSTILICAINQLTALSCLSLGALTVLKQFLDSNLEHVSNKSAYLCGVMKTYRQKSRTALNASQGGSPTGRLVMFLDFCGNIFTPIENFLRGTEEQKFFSIQLHYFS